MNKYLTERGQTSWDAYRRLSDELPATVDWLRAQSDFTKDQKALLLTIEKKLLRCLNWLLSTKEKTDAMLPQESIEYLNDPENSMLMVYQTLINDIISLSKLNSAELAEGPKEQRRLRQQNRHITFAGIGINIALALTLAFVFTKNITGRLNLMVENTVRLKDSKELLGPVGGKDEISSSIQHFIKWPMIWPRPSV